MKKGIAILTAAVCAGAMSASADVLVAAWDAFDSASASAPTFEATGITATLAQTDMSNASTEDRGASSDTTWGSFDGNGNPASAVIVGNVNLVSFNGSDGSFQLTIVNNGASDLDLSAFHFDALAFRPNTARTFTVDVAAGSDITVGNVYTSGAQEITSLGTAPNAAQDQHDEYDLDLTGLGDNTLATGETAIFNVAFFGGTSGSSGHHLWVDNIAVTAIPEPATLGMVAAFGGGILFIRRRFMM